MKRIPALWWVFFTELILFVLIISGVLPRNFAWLLAMLLAGYSFRAPLEDCVVLFVMSIPLFIALPITNTFDNFNTWRIVSLIIFTRWLLMHDTRAWLASVSKEFLRAPFKFKIQHLGITLLLSLGFFAVFSLIGAPDIIAGAKRIIYFSNLALIPIVAYNLLRRPARPGSPEFSRRLIRAVAVPTAVVVVVGVLQVISTYLIDIYQFMRIWGEGIQLRQFGTEWSNIAVWLGNTWFAYYGEQLSLRVFSLSPDSHSFPQFVLMGLPAIFALISRRRVLGVILAIFALLMTILSGTRGIWAAGIGVAILAGFLLFWMHRTRVSVESKRMLRRVSASLIAFFFLFAVAWPIFTSPQFLMAKGDWKLMRNRIKSILDFGETSNSQRLEIWRQSLISIEHHPILGIGIGNFPTVLNQRIVLARAGSSAHNIYLHIAAEMGLPAFAAVIVLVWLLIARTYRAFIKCKDAEHQIYFAGLLLMIPWVLLYSLTDVALFDERAFLLFLTTASIVVAGAKSKQ